MASGDEKFSRVIDGLRPHTLQSSRLFRSFMMWNDGNDASTNNMRASNTPAKPTELAVVSTRARHAAVAAWQRRDTLVLGDHLHDFHCLDATDDARDCDTGAVSQPPRLGTKPPSTLFLLARSHSHTRTDDTIIGAVPSSGLSDGTRVDAAVTRSVLAPFIVAFGGSGGGARLVVIDRHLAVGSQRTAVHQRSIGEHARVVEEVTSGHVIGAVLRERRESGTRVDRSSSGSGHSSIPSRTRGFSERHHVPR